MIVEVLMGDIFWIVKIMMEVSRIVIIVGAFGVIGTLIVIQLRREIRLVPRVSLGIIVAEVVEADIKIVQETVFVR
jgi:hypothetical protein